MSADYQNVFLLVVLVDCSISKSVASPRTGAPVQRSLAPRRSAGNLGCMGRRERVGEGGCRRAPETQQPDEEPSARATVDEHNTDGPVLVAMDADHLKTPAATPHPSLCSYFP